MPSISKFLFDTSFDGPAKAAPAKPVRRNFTAAELEAEKGKAFAEGHAAGVAEATNEIASRHAAAAEAIAKRFAETFARLEQHRADSTQTAVAAATAMMRKLLPALGRSEAASEIEALVRDCLGRLHDEPKIVIRLRQDLVDAFRSRIDELADQAGFSGKVVVVADARVGEGDAKVEWADGGVERNTQLVWQEIGDIIERFVAAGPATGSRNGA
jgi:flagellar assembly protein FliH